MEVLDEIIFIKGPYNVIKGGNLRYACNYSRKITAGDHRGGATMVGTAVIFAMATSTVAMATVVIRRKGSGKGGYSVDRGTVVVVTLVTYQEHQLKELLIFTTMTS